MNTVILKWNPAVSSYKMLHYLQDLNDIIGTEMTDFNWSVWDYDKIHAGDRYYLVKLGYGQTGIVSSGIITSEPYLDSDWRDTKNTIYYVDFLPNVMINPDTLPILTSEELSNIITDFEWFKGHSGMVLDASQANKLEKTWESYLSKNNELFNKALDSNDNNHLYLDLNYENSNFNNLEEELTEDNTITIHVNRDEYMLACYQNEFYLELNDNNYKQIIRHIDGNPIVTAKDLPKRYYGVYWHNKGVFPYILRKGIKFLKLVYAHQYLVAEINDVEEDNFYATNRFSMRKNHEEHLCNNGACCHWSIRLWVPILAREYDESIFPSNERIY